MAPAVLSFFFFFPAGATLKFISEVVQRIRKYKEKSDGGFSAGGHCDLASMCYDALRAHLSCGLTWETWGGEGGWGVVGGRPDIYLCLSESKANQQLDRKGEGARFGRRRKNASSAPTGLCGPTEVCVCVFRIFFWGGGYKCKALPSAMRCSGTCRITRTERLQER